MNEYSIVLSLTVDPSHASLNVKHVRDQQTVISLTYLLQQATEDCTESKRRSRTTQAEPSFCSTKVLSLYQ